MLNPKEFTNKYITLVDLAKALESTKRPIDHNDRLTALNFLESEDGEEEFLDLMDHYGIELKRMRP